MIIRLESLIWNQTSQLWAELDVVTLTTLSPVLSEQGHFLSAEEDTALSVTSK